jgi:hypothetical protein
MLMCPVVLMLMPVSSGRARADRRVRGMVDPPATGGLSRCLSAQRRAVPQSLQLASPVSALRSRSHTPTDRIACSRIASHITYTLFSPLFRQAGQARARALRAWNSNASLWQCRAFVRLRKHHLIAASDHPGTHHAARQLGSQCPSQSSRLDGVLVTQDHTHAHPRQRQSAPLRRQPTGASGPPPSRLTTAADRRRGSRRCTRAASHTIADSCSGHRITDQS